METVSDFIFLGSKITADGDCIHEIKRRLLLGRKIMTNLDNIPLLGIHTEETRRERDEPVETVSDLLIFGAPKSLQMVIAAMKLKDAYSLEGKLWPT